jgi:hypothetical protein
MFPALNKSYSEYQYVVDLGLISLPVTHYANQFLFLLLHGLARYADQ